MSPTLISRWSTEPCRPGTRWIPTDRLPRTSSWSPTWESACCSASRVPARPNNLVPPSSPQTTTPSMILLSKAVVFAMDMLTSVCQPGATNPANRRPITWWVIFVNIQLAGARYSTGEKLLHSLLCCEKLLRCFVTLASFCLHFYLFYVVRLGVEGLRFCSHHSLVTQLCAGMHYWSWRLQWRLDIRPQLYLPLQGFKDVETLIMVFSLML